MARNDVLVSPYYRPDLVQIATIIEMLSLMCLLIAVSFYLRIATRREFCHRNLLVLLLGHPCVHVSIMLLRALRHLLFFLGYLGPISLKIINYVSDTCVSTSFVIVLGYSIERVVAMYYVHTYETMWTKRPTLGIGLFLWSICYSAFLIGLWHMDILKNAMAYGTQMVMFALTTLFFIYLRVRSGRIYRAVAEKKDSTVEERYLSARNLKAAMLLMRLAPFKCVTNYFSFGIYFWCFEMNSPYYFPLYSAIYYTISQLQLYAQMLLTIYGHEVLKEEFMLYQKQFESAWGPVPESGPKGVKQKYWLSNNRVNV
ncbi:unnamed protein product, partial [Mesorhabditis spiculigera]